MSRSRQNPNSTSVSLFPFLAVLLCTMGALVMLLVAMAHVSREQARLKPDATEVAQPADSPTAEEKAQADADAKQRRTQLDEAEQYLAKVEEQQTELDETLREDQLKLSHTEDHIRRLTDKLVSMQAAIAELQQQDAEHYDDIAQAERNLKQLEALVAETKAEIEELEGEQSEQSGSFSIVPYRGANGTRRKPIYIECLDDRVVLQPEGVELTADDFRKPLGVGNPLAAALRASREYHVRNNPDAGFDPDAEPYPLIIVRPDGILAYYGVREAIRSWDSDFGYEMVDADWDLEFPAANPVLFDLQTRAVERARARRELLARAAPRAYGGGGFHPTGSRQSGGRSSQRPYDGTTLGYPGRGQAQGGLAGGGRESNGQGGERGGPADPANFQPTTGAGGEGDSQAENRAAAKLGRFQRSDAAKGGAQQGNQGGEGSTRPPAGAVAENSGAPSSSQGSSRQSSSPSGGASGGDQGAAAPGSASSTASRDVSLTAEANKRGADWAVEKNSPADIAIRRSVQVVVHNDRLVVLPGKRRRTASRRIGVVGKTVYLDGATQNGLEAFVSEVRKQVDSWGMAGQGLYWRPVLMLNVGPTGTSRARDLTQLLQRSGLDVKFERTATLPTAGGADETR